MNCDFCIALMGLKNNVVHNFNYGLTHSVRPMFLRAMFNLQKLGKGFERFEIRYGMTLY
jgi:hypothetical protein